jgi:hypothetical protein
MARLHPGTGAAPRPRHHSGGPHITPLKDAALRASAHDHGKEHGKGAAEEGGGSTSSASADPQDARWEDEESIWEDEAAEELASDMWLDELEHRMNTVYQRIGKEHPFAAAAGRLGHDDSDEGGSGAGSGAGSAGSDGAMGDADAGGVTEETDGAMGMTRAFEEELVNDQARWMRELDREIEAVYQGMGEEAVPSPGPPKPAHTDAGGGGGSPANSSVPPQEGEVTAAAAAAAAESEQAGEGSACPLGDLLEGLEELRAFATMAESGASRLTAAEREEAGRLARRRTQEVAGRRQMMGPEGGAAAAAATAAAGGGAGGGLDATLALRRRAQEQVRAHLRRKARGASLFLPCHPSLRVPGAGRWRGCPLGSWLSPCVRGAGCCMATSLSLSLSRSLAHSGWRRWQEVRDALHAPYHHP